MTRTPTERRRENDPIDDLLDGASVADLRRDSFEAGVMRQKAGRLLADRILTSKPPPEHPSKTKDR